MALSNAERQRRHRERVKAKLAAPGVHGAAGCLSAEQTADRDAVMDGPIYPVPKDTSQLPTFMGWNRYDWSYAPEALIDHFGMRSAFEGWQEEKRLLAEESDAIRQRHQAIVQEIEAEHGKEICERAKEGCGTLRLLDNYRKDRSLAAFRGKKGRRVT